MAVTFADLTIDPQTLVDAASTYPVRIVIRTNTEGAIIDADANKIFLGTYATDTKTTATISLPVTNGATNPTGFQYTADLEYIDAYTRKRKTWNSGWFSFTAAADLTDIAAEQYVPPTYATTLTAELDAHAASLQAPMDAKVTAAQAAQAAAEAARDAAVDISGIATPDDLVEDLVLNTGGAGPLTSAAVTDAIDARVPQATMAVFGKVRYATLSEAALGDATDRVVDVYTATTVYKRATVAVGAGIDPTGATDSGAAIQALIDAAPSGAEIILPITPLGYANYKSSVQLLIEKSMTFGCESVPRATNDNSHQNAGSTITYTGTSGDALTARPPLPDAGNDNGKISVHLVGFQIVGNKNVVGATDGRCLVLDGRDGVPACGIVQFVLEDVKLVEAFDDNLTIVGEVYEGRVVGLNSARAGGRNISVENSTTGIPGEIVWIDIHSGASSGDTNVYLGGRGTHQFMRWSSSQAAGRAFWVYQAVVNGFGLQCETTGGDACVVIENANGCSITGLNVDYTSPSATSHGVWVKGTSEGTSLNAVEFSGTTTGWDILTDATSLYTEVHNYRGSAANKVSLLGGRDIIWRGAEMVNGTLVLSADKADRTVQRIIGFAGQTADLSRWETSTGTVVTRVTNNGEVRSAEQVYAKYGAGTQVAIGAVSTGKGGIVTSDVSLFRDDVDTWRTADRMFVAGFGAGYVAKTAAYTLTRTDYTVDGDATAGTFSLTLPSAADRAGQIYVLRKKDASANAVTVATTSAQTINGAATYSLAAQYDKVRVQSDGANWIII